ncbi:MAG: glycosyltransferase family 2 protein [Anaerolineae bacterium]
MARFSNGEDVRPKPLDPAIDISIIIVSWNVSQLLEKCLQSIYSNANELGLQVIVVDSGSADATCAMVRQKFPQVELFDMQQNVGFPAGNNIGIQAAVGRNIYLLNPDTEIIEDALQVMLHEVESNPQLGLIGSWLQYPDGKIQSSRRRFPTIMTGLFESTWLEPLAPKSLLDRYFMRDKPDDRPCEADWVMGASMFASREAVQTVGGLDEGYFMYSEELDWCRRVKEAGFKIIWLPEAKVIHHLGASSDQASTRRHINFNRAKLRYFRKYHGIVASGLIRMVLLANFVSQILIEGSKWLFGHRRDLRKQRIQAYWQVVCSGLRPAGY